MNRNDLLNTKKVGIIGCVRIALAVSPTISLAIFMFTIATALAPTFQIQAIARFVDSTIQVVQEGMPVKNTFIPIVILMLLAFYMWMVKPLMVMFWLRLKERMIETYRTQVVSRRAKLLYMYAEDSQAMDTMTRVTKEAENEIIKILQVLCE